MTTRPLLEGFVPWPADVADGYRRCGYWSGETLGATLSRLASVYGPRRALVDARGEVSYAQLEARAERLALGFHRLGLAADDVVVVQLPNSVLWYEVCFALWKLGAIPVLANPSHRAFEITSFCSQTHAKAYVVPDTFERFDYRDLATSVRQTAGVEHVFVAGSPGPHTSLDRARELGGTLAVLPAIDASRVALLQLSGGSTGAPKLIPRTHDDYLYSVRQSVAVCAWDSGVTAAIALPCSHNFPLSSPGALGALLAGGSALLLASPTPSAALPLIERYAATTVALVPALARLWLDASPRDGLRNLAVQVGGAKLDPSLASALYERTAGKLQQVFGMAEGLVNYTRADDDVEHVLTTQGRPMSSADEIRIVDDEDQPVSAGRVGHLLTRGPYTIRGYYAAAAHNEVSFTRDGYYRTGDLVRQLSSGHLVVEGRAKDQINRAGEKIAAEEIELLLRRTGLVTDAALVAIPDAFLGEKSCAFVCGADSSLSLESVRAALRELGVAAYKIPDRLVWLPELPRTSIGKVNKVALRAHA